MLLASKDTGPDQGGGGRRAAVKGKTGFSDSSLLIEHSDYSEGVRKAVRGKHAAVFTVGRKNSGRRVGGVACRVSGYETSGQDKKNEVIRKGGEIFGRVAQTERDGQEMILGKKEFSSKKRGTAAEFKKKQRLA